MRLLIISSVLLAVAACQKPQDHQGQQPANAPAAEAQSGPMKGVDRSHKGQSGPDAMFKDPDGADVSLADLAGTPVLVNLWATWCAPCVKELPTLDRLSGMRKGITILAVSQDTGPHASVEAFLRSKKIANLDAYQDSNMGLSGALGPETVLPTTILYDKSGKEVWRYVGDLDWTSAQAARLLAEAKPGGKG
jgi:thiol-disulfide isomerase/thioredoxin